MLLKDDEADELVQEFNNGKLKDMTSKIWRDILNKLREIHNKLKMKKSKVFDQ